MIKRLILPICALFLVLFSALRSDYHTALRRKICGLCFNVIANECHMWKLRQLKSVDINYGTANMKLLNIRIVLQRMPARRSVIEIPFTRIGVFRRSCIRLHITSVLYITFWSLSCELNFCCYGTDLERSRVSNCRLTHCGRVTQISIFTLLLCKTDDANLRF